MKKSVVVLVAFFLSAVALSLVVTSVQAQQVVPKAIVSKDTIVDGYRHFIMPSAKPVQGGYAGVWELAFLQAGVGIEDVLSITGGFTIMPTVSVRSQFGFLQAKLTLADEGGLSFAAGMNLLRLTSEHLYTHLFAVGTYETTQHTRFTGLFFYKLTGDDYPIVNVFPYGTFAFNYGGAVGIGAGFDTPVPEISNLRIVAEVWNHDIQSPTKLAALLALRVENAKFSSDFGFMYFTLPILAPVANFVWRF
ncbi:MAG: hypothetical protein ABI444_07475 [Candidatus Kapaibacterium sp.]|jgi:hypothetical protein